MFLYYIPPLDRATYDCDDIALTMGVLGWVGNCSIDLSTTNIYVGGQLLAENLGDVVKAMTKLGWLIHSRNGRGGGINWGLISDNPIEFYNETKKAMK